MDYATTAFRAASPARAQESYAPASRERTVARSPRTGCRHVAAEPVSRPERHESVQALRLNDILEAQMRRIAHSLHDEAGQLLAAVHIKLDEVTRKLPAERIAGLQAVKGMLDEMELQLRRLSHELRPMILDDLGLGPGVEFLKRRVSKRTGLSIALNVSIPRRLPARAEMVLYRVIQEALDDIAAHARATHVCITLRTDSRGVSCSICDNGRGFDVAVALGEFEGRGIGLLGIRERIEDLSGSLRIASAPGRGTEIQIALPSEQCGVAVVAA